MFKSFRAGFIGAVWHYFPSTLYKRMSNLLYFSLLSELILLWGGNFISWDPHSHLSRLRVTTHGQIVSIIHHEDEKKRFLYSDLISDLLLSPYTFLLRDMFLLKIWDEKTLNCLNNSSHPMTAHKKCTFASVEDKEVTLDEEYIQFKGESPAWRLSSPMPDSHHLCV